MSFLSLRMHGMSTFVSKDNSYLIKSCIFWNNEEFEKMLEVVTFNFFKDGAIDKLFGSQGIFSLVSNVMNDKFVKNMSQQEKECALLNCIEKSIIILQVSCCRCRFHNYSSLHSCCNKSTTKPMKAEST